MDPQDYQNLLRKACETQYSVYPRKNPVTMICCNNHYGTSRNSSFLNENERNQLKQIYEDEYSALVKSNQKSTYKYWEGKDDVRYYNELLNELEAENRKPIDYPNITEKLLLILAVSFSFYISSSPDFSTRENVSLTSLAFLFYSLIKESLTAGFAGRSFIRVFKYYNHLDKFVHKRFKPYQDIRKYHGIKLRIFALDNRKNQLTVIYIILDIVFNIVIIILAFNLQFIRKEPFPTNIFEPDAFMYFWICCISIIFSSVYLKIACDNWDWLQNAKSKLYS